MFRAVFKIFNAFVEAARVLDCRCSCLRGKSCVQSIWVLAGRKGSRRRNDLSPLLVAPHVLHAEPRTLPAGTQFEVLVDKDDCHVPSDGNRTAHGVDPTRPWSG